jgi:preprotein translocase subunit SecE
LDKLKLLLAALILGVGVGGFYYFSDQSDLLRVPGLMVMVALAVVVALQTDIGRQAQEFGRGSVRELRQVVWPARKETAQVTLVVVAMVVAVAVFLWIVDLGLQKALQLLIGQRS